MESILIDDIFELLEEVYDIDREELVVEKREYRHVISVLHNFPALELSICPPGKYPLCTWKEVRIIGSPIFFDRKGEFQRDGLQDWLHRQLSCSSSVAKFYAERSKRMRKEKEQLLEMLRYSPGGEGYLEAKEHFERLQ
ncbi:HTH-containing DNA-binding protein [Marseillevirus Shanghai 1]|nr:HTH-containing DNA-binding protein [Marseillevirus Shanghai 1]